MEFQEDGMTEIGAVRIRRGRWLDGFFARVEPLDDTLHRDDTHSGRER